jgi:hypothetical protein
VKINDPLILDTCVFRDGSFLKKLEKYHGKKILPAVAYAEVCLYLIGKRHKKPAEVDYYINKLGIEVEWLTKTRAQYAALYGIKGEDFKDNNRDYLIGAHAYPPPRTMITYNKKDFWFIKRNFLYDSDEILKKIEK